MKTKKLLKLSAFQLAETTLQAFNGCLYGNRQKQDLNQRQYAINTVKRDL